MGHTMKYLKRFESTSVDYYYEYTPYYDFILNSEKIQTAYSDSQSKLINLLKNRNLEFEVCDYFIVIHQENCSYYINEYVDYWFSVEEFNYDVDISDLYLCDQYEGLIKLLKDKEII